VDRRVMSERAARTLLAMMQGVTEDGTAKAAAIPGYPVAGKTGTAQKVTGGRYDPSRYLSSFVGIVPADAPRLVIAVMIDEPQGIHYGGVVAAPAFKAIAETALRYLGVAPTQPLVAKNRAARHSERRTAEAEGDGPGIDEPAAILATEAGATDEGVLGEPDEARGESVQAAEGFVLLPDFTGMGMGQAIRAAHRAGVEVLPSGSGLAVTQTPKPGTVPTGTVCRVSFQRAGG